jgi:hypothetical protein
MRRPICRPAFPAHRCTHYIPWTAYVLSLPVIWSIGTPIALVESMFPRRRTEPWLGTPRLIIIAVLYVLGLLAAFGTTWLEYR